MNKSYEVGKKFHTLISLNPLTATVFFGIIYTNIKFTYGGTQMRVMDEEKLNKVLRCIREHQETGKAPNYRQIQKECRIASLSSVSLYVNELKKRGLIETETQGGWKQIRTPSYFRASETHNTFVVGDVHCGPPTDAVECIEACVALPNEIFGDAEHVILHAKGPSMINRGIFDGDLLIVRRTPYAEYGQTVIAMIDNCEATCKVYEKGRSGPYLRAANDVEVNGKRKYDVHPKGEWSIYGVVDYVIHAPVSDEF